MNTAMLTRVLNTISKPSVLWLSFILMNAITFGLFKVLPDLPGLLIDLMPSYTRAEVLAVLAEIGEAGRATYRWANLVDFAFAVCYGTFFMGFLYRFRAMPLLGWLVVLPAALALVDFAENSHIRMMLLAYPELDTALVARASLLTQTKHLLTYLTLGAFALTALFAGVRWLRGRNKA